VGVPVSTPDPALPVMVNPGGSIPPHPAGGTSTYWDHVKLVLLIPPVAVNEVV
jgi:hypothetical protein